MKLSFSTNGWKLPFSKLTEIACEFRIEGIEIHDVAALTASDEAPFAPENIAVTVRRLNENGLRITCLDAISNLADTASYLDAVSEIDGLIKLAKDLNCEFIRIRAFATDTAPYDEATETKIRDLVSHLLPKAEAAGIVLLVETMGVYADSNRLKDLLDNFASDYLGVLWDAHHTYWYADESAEKTIKNLGAYVKHLHVKDSRKGADGNVSYGLMGQGELPISKVFDALRSINYDGYVSLEMQPGWVSELGEVDIVFPQFVGYMSSFEGVPSWQKRLYDNQTKTGKYVWEKEVLIDCTFSQVLDRMCEEFPDQIAFKFTTLDYTRTYAEFRDDVDEFARTLIALGVKRGSKVAVWATNVPEWYISFWATTKIGAILVTVNTAYKIHEAEYLLRQSDTHTLVMIESYRDSNYKDIIAELCPELAAKKKGEQLHSKRLPMLRNVITVGFSMKGAMTFDESLEMAKTVPYEEVKRRAAAVGLHDVCNMQYTSGTTGFPKGVMLTHYNIVNNGKCIGDRMDLSTADRMMIQVPMFHCFGMVLAMTASMTHGVSLFPLPYYSPKLALSCINSERITAFHGVPTMFIGMLAHDDFAKTDFSYMRTGIMAGSPCPISVMQEVVDKMNMKQITIVYGQTEASPGCTMSSTDDSLEVRVATVGRPLPNIECKIVDPATNQDLPDNEIGEFVARGYNLMKGYYKMPAETAQAIDAEGWLHTGDLAMRDSNGNYRITGRLKDMIIRGGENLYPKEIEDFIYTIPTVKDVQVVGVSDEKYGEEAYAYIILQDGATTTEEELRAYMTARIAKHKVPRYIEITDSFPMNVAGKILKYKMRETAEAKLKAAKK